MAGGGRAGPFDRSFLESGLSVRQTPLPQTPREINAILRGIFADGPWALRQLQLYRPYLCPFERIVPYVPAGARVLDVGCGGGLLLGLLRAIGRISSGVGFDPSGAAIAVANRMAARSANSEIPLDFRQLGVQDRWPDGSYDAVLVIDLVHHLPHGLRPSVFEAAAERLEPGGILLYKDIGPRPRWRALGNTLHDLVLARQLVSYSPLDLVASWADRAGLDQAGVESPHRLWYSHEIQVYRKPPSHNRE